MKKVEEFTVIEVDNIAEISSKFLSNEYRDSVLKDPPKIHSGMVWQVLKALEVGTPKCKECENDQLMIFKNMEERSYYYCLMCETRIDYEFWLNGMYAKNGFYGPILDNKKNARDFVPVASKTEAVSE